MHDGLRFVIKIAYSHAYQTQHLDKLHDNLAKVITDKMMNKNLFYIFKFLDFFSDLKSF